MTFTLADLNFSCPSTAHARLPRLPCAKTSTAGIYTCRFASAVFNQLGTQWRLCMQTDTSDGEHGSLAVFLQMVGEAISEPVAFTLRVVAESGDKVRALTHR